MHRFHRFQRKFEGGNASMVVCKLKKRGGGGSIGIFGVGMLGMPTDGPIGL